MQPARTGASEEVGAAAGSSAFFCWVTRSKETHSPSSPPPPPPPVPPPAKIFLGPLPFVVRAGTLYSADDTPKPRRRSAHAASTSEGRATCKSRCARCSVASRASSLPGLPSPSFTRPLILNRTAAFDRRPSAKPGRTLLLAARCGILSSGFPRAGVLVPVSEMDRLTSCHFGKCCSSPVAVCA